MKHTENLMDMVPYRDVDLKNRLRLMLLEAPGGAVTAYQRVRNRQTMAVETAQAILTEAVERLDGPLADNLKTAPKISSFLGMGFEATVFTVDTKDGKWVMKAGLPKSCVPGLYAPSSDRYAAMMSWNYNLLKRTFTQELPHVLPDPYFIVSPSELGKPMTIQFLPYVEKLADLSRLTLAQRLRLIEERQKFYEVSKVLMAKHKAMPDLVGSKNLVVGVGSGETHYCLVDFGLFHFQAPTPILNFLEFAFQQIALIKDVSSLKRGLRTKVTAQRETI
jgi:hypothetical protein